MDDVATTTRESVIGRLSEIEEAKINMGSRIDKYILADNMKPLDFTKADRKGYIEYEPGLFIKDITSRVQEILGLTVLHAFTTKDITLDSHKHTIQYQVITVKSGKIYDEETMQFKEAGESMFIPKGRNHKVKYYENSEYIIYYVPNLEPA